MIFVASPNFAGQSKVDLKNQDCQDPPPKINRKPAVGFFLFIRSDGAGRFDLL
jgi:hypothetical protein